MLVPLFGYNNQQFQSIKTLLATAFLKLSVFTLDYKMCLRIRAHAACAPLPSAIASKKESMDLASGDSGSGSSSIITDILR
jgi:hypothetical protein